MGSRHVVGLIREVVRGGDPFARFVALVCLGMVLYLLHAVMECLRVHSTL